MTKKTSFFPGIFLPYHLVTREPYSWSGWFRTSFRFQGLLQRYSGNRWKKLRNVNPFMVKPDDWGSYFIMLYHPISRSSKYIIPIIPNPALGMVYDSLSHNFPWLFPNDDLWLSYDPSKYSQWMARVTSPWHLRAISRCCCWWESLVLARPPNCHRSSWMLGIMWPTSQVRWGRFVVPCRNALRLLWHGVDGLVYNGWITGVSYGTNLMVDTYRPYRHII